MAIKKGTLDVTAAAIGADVLNNIALGSDLLIETPEPVESELFTTSAAAIGSNESNDTSGWSAVGQINITSESTPDTPQDGSYYIEVEGTDSGGTGDRAQYNVPVEVGEQYEVRIFAREANGTQGRIQLFAGVSGWSTVQLTSTWTEYVQTVTATSTTMTMRFYPNSGSGIVGSVIHLDKISVKKLVSNIPTVEEAVFSSSDNSVITMTKPSGVQNGDLLLIIVGNDTPNPSVEYDNVSNKPTGFTLIDTINSTGVDVSIAAFWRIADGTEGATIDVEGATTSADTECIGWYYRITGANSTSPIGTVGTSVETSPTPLIPEIITNEDNSLVIGALVFDGGDGHPFTLNLPESAGWTLEESNREASTSASISGFWASKQIETAGATGNIEASAQVSDGTSRILITINP